MSVPVLLAASCSVTRNASPLGEGLRLASTPEQLLGALTVRRPLVPKVGSGWPPSSSAVIRRYPLAHCARRYRRPLYPAMGETPWVVFAEQPDGTSAVPPVP